MIATVAAALIALAVHASSSGGDNSGELAFLLAGPAGGAALYGAVYAYYRNADKTHRFEKETLIERKGEITGSDERVDRVTATRQRRIRGENTRDYRRRLRPLE